MAVDVIDKIRQKTSSSEFAEYPIGTTSRYIQIEDDKQQYIDDISNILDIYEGYSLNQSLHSLAQAIHVLQLNIKTLSGTSVAEDDDGEWALVLTSI